MPAPNPQCGRHDCAGCHLMDSVDAATRGGLRGWRLAGWAVSLFLGPLAAATLGARLAGDSPLRQVAGGLTGLVVGLAVLAALGRWRLGR